MKLYGRALQSKSVCKNYLSNINTSSNEKNNNMRMQNNRIIDTRTEISYLRQTRFSSTKYQPATLKSKNAQKAHNTKPTSIEDHKFPKAPPIRAKAIQP